VAKDLFAQRPVSQASLGKQGSYLLRGLYPLMLYISFTFLLIMLGASFLASSMGVIFLKIVLLDLGLRQDGWYVVFII
jgi:hypothetical protein